MDYAAKAWSGFTKTFYKQRWALFFRTLQGSPDFVVDQAMFNDAVLAQVEQPWQQMTHDEGAALPVRADGGRCRWWWRRRSRQSTPSE